MATLKERTEIRTAIRQSMAAGTTYDMSGNDNFALAYPWPTSGTTMQLAGTSAEDDVLGGDGIRQVELNLVDTNFRSRTLIVQTPGATADPAIVDPSDNNSSWLRCNGMRGTDGGASAATGGASGTISLQSVGGADLYAQILPGQSIWGGCVYTIPSDETIELFEFDIESYDASQQSEFAAGLHSRRPTEEVWNLEATSRILNNSAGDSSVSKILLPRMKFQAGTDLVVRVENVSSTSNALARLSLHRRQGSGPL